MNTASSRKKFLMGVSTILTMGSLVLLPGISTVYGDQAQSNSSQSSLSQVVPPAGGSSPLGNEGMTADAIARSEFSNIYGGMALTNNGTHVNVYLTQLSSQTESAIEGNMPTADFTFIQTPHTLNQMLTLHQQVSSQDSSILANGIHLVLWGPDITTGTETLEVENLSPTDTAYLNSQFGSGNITIKNVAADQVPVPTDRSNDSSPWNGGDFITDNVTGDCTSGYGASSGSIQYLITAAHCFAANNTIYNGAMTLQIGNMNAMGWVANRDTASNGLDAELIETSADGGSSNLVYTGSSTNPSRATVSGATTSPVGYQVCMDGAFEGEICGLVIQKTNICINETEGSTTRAVCNIVEAQNTSGGIAVGAGDSGGPVFRFNGSLLDATGIVTAGSGAVACTNYPAGGRPCYSTLYYTDINSILSYFTVSLNT